jgi:hypothetical protein
LKSWANHDVVTATGPIRWITKPEEVTTPLEVDAYVVSAPPQSGEELTFETPKFGA